MTLEGPAPGQDETPAPPARTRWSEEPADDDAGLMPPYVPGAREAKAPAPAPSPETRAPHAAEEAPGAAEEAFPFDVPAGEDSGEDSFPFEAPVDKDDVPMEAPVGEDDFAAGAPVGEGSYPFEAPVGEEALPDEGTVGEDDFPFEAFDIAGPAEPAAETPAEVVAPGGEPGLADRLQQLADALRRDGRRGIEREMRSGDRFTALLAGVVAGYLAGLEE